MKDKQFLINLISSLINFAINIGIGFILTSYIVSHVGAEAYGFIGLANNMINYASFLTIALNSVAGRFITVAYHQGQREEADKYFSSTLAANFILSAILSAVAIPLIWKLEVLVNISPALVKDVKLLFGFVFLNFIITTMTTVLNVATFVKNQLYLSSLANIAYSLMRVITLFLLYSLLPARVFYVGVATCLGTVVLSWLNYRYTKLLTPDLRFRTKEVSVEATRHMLSSGIWNSIIKLQQILSDGLCLLIANLMVSAHSMGLLSIAQVIPNALSGIINTVSSLFYPEQTRFFAQKNKNAMISQIKTGMRVSGLFANIIVVVLVTSGYRLIQLWQPDQDDKTIYILMVLTLSGFSLSGVASTLQNIPLITNRLRAYSLCWLLCGVVSFLGSIALAAWTSLGVYAIAAVPQATGFLMNLLFVPIYASKQLGIKWTAFYPVYLQYIVASIIACCCCSGLQIILGKHEMGWATYFATCFLYASITAGIDFFVLLGKQERSRMADIIKHYTAKLL